MGLGGGVKISAGNGIAMEEGEPLRVGVPTWAMRLMYRLGMLQAGRVYNVLIVMPHQGEPSWSVISDSKLETQSERTPRHE